MVRNAVSLGELSRKRAKRPIESKECRFCGELFQPRTAQAASKRTVCYREPCEKEWHREKLASKRRRYHDRRSF